MRVYILKFFYTIGPFVSLINPFYGVLFYLLISVVRPETLTWGNAVVSGVFLTSSICLLISCCLRGYIKITTFYNPVVFCMISYVSFLFISTIMSPLTINEIKGGMYYMTSLFQITLFCICLYAVLELSGERVLFMIIKFLLILFMFMALWGVEQHSRGNVLVEGLFGTAITDRCAIAGVFILYFPLAIWTIRSHARVFKLIGIFGLLIFGAIIIFTESRGGFLGACAAVFTMIIYLKKTRLLIMCAVLSLALFPILPDNYIERIKSIQMQDVTGYNQITDYSSASRLALWRLGLDVFLDNPIIGVGNLNFQKVSVEYRADYIDHLDTELYQYIFGRGDSGLQIHNMFIDILAEGGLLAAIPFYLLILIPLYMGNKSIVAYRLLDKSKEAISLIMLQQSLISGLVGFFITAIFANDRFIDFFYWNLIISFYVSRRIKELITYDRCLSQKKSGKGVARC